MDVHLVIPTYNPDYQSVNRLISSIEKQSYQPTTVTFVENGSESTWLKTRCDLNKRFHYERSGLGANKARNHGAANKSGLLIFTDDDCIPNDDFITGHLLAHKRNPDSIIGGKVQLSFKEDPPDWLICGFRKSLAEVSLEENYNILGAERYIDPSEYLVTANLSCPAEIFHQLGGFDEDCGYIGDMLAPNDEHLFLATAMMNQIGCIYTSTALVEHVIPPYRMTLEYFRERYFGQGWADALLNDKMGRLFGSTTSVTELCLTDIFLQNAILSQVKHAEKLSGSVPPQYTANLLICSAEYVRGVLEYEKGLHTIRSENGESASIESTEELGTSNSSAK